MGIYGNLHNSSIQLSSDVSDCIDYGDWWLDCRVLDASYVHHYMVAVMVEAAVVVAEEEVAVIAISVAVVALIVAH